MTTDVFVHFEALKDIIVLLIKNELIVYVTEIGFHYVYRFIE